ncbi:hypothetical protein ACH5RR_019776 [Cinchona calisaya]|uniref:non-specific serine/threonine protein kinase n=1 Tax=Cinchona calisaya TaxID=153742 RepID=A0ABD2ZTX6_9GENT
MAMTVFLGHFFLLLVLLAGTGLAESVQEECAPVRCGDSGPEIRFPFWLKKSQPDICGYPVKVSVQEINYKTRVIQVAVLNASSCLPNQLPSSSMISSPFDVSDFPLASCGKMYDISDVPTEMFAGPQEYSPNHVYLRWSKPSCEICEAKGKYCRLRNNGTNTTDQGTQCFDNPHQPGHKTGPSTKSLIIGLAVSLSIILLTVVSMGAIICLKRKKQEKKNNENVLEDYKALRPAQFSCADIKKITNQFKEKLGQGSYGTVFRGKLANDIFVAVKVLDNSKRNSEDFIGELVKRNGIQHPNVVRLIGCCADGNRRALVYELLSNGSLKEFISSGKQNSQLEWDKLQQIAIGIAKGLDYLHHRYSQEVLHLDIKPRNVLLDQNYIPKVTDFGLTRLCSKEQIVLSMTSSQDGSEYIAPEVLSSNFGNASSKSDVYSFGMLLFDMVGGTKRYLDGAGPSSQVYPPELVYDQLNREEEIAIQVDGEENSMIKKKLLLVGLLCTQWYPSNRPSMERVVQMIEGDDLPVVPPNAFAPTESK